jgi:hypothetical protein
VVGLLRDMSGSYTLPFYGCIGLELIAAALIMMRGGSKLTRPAAATDRPNPAAW